MRILLQVVLAAALLCSVAPASAAAATVRVKSTDTTPDTVSCGSNSNPCDTIQRGVDVANTDDKVQVLPGTYTEVVQVNKKLVIEGPQKGNDATFKTPTANKEAVVIGGFHLVANSIRLDGFTIQDNPNGPGVETSPLFSGYEILHNIIRNNVFGLYLHSEGTKKTTVSRNRFQENNQTGAANGNGIYSDQGLKKADVVRNRFVQHGNSAFTLTKGTTEQANNSNVLFERNSSERDVNMLNIYSTDNFTASRNEAKGINDPNVDGGAIFIAGGNNNVKLERNNIHDRSWSGIIIANLVAIPNTKVKIERNEIRDVGHDGIDIRTDSIGAGDALVDHNEVRRAGRDGLLLGAGTSDNDIFDNELHSNVEHDAHDDSIGTGTAGTGNNWDDNECATDMPSGLCED